MKALYAENKSPTSVAGKGTNEHYGVSNVAYRVRRCWPQPIVGMVTAMIAITALAGSWLPWLSRGNREEISLPYVLATIGLTFLISLAYRHPIHVHNQTKVTMTTVPIFLAAVLLPPPLATLSGAVGMIIGELLTRPQTGNTIGDIVTGVGRYTVVILVGSLLAQATSLASTPRPLIFVYIAIVMWTIDFFSLPLVLAPMAEERPLRIMPLLIREAGPVEAAQYLLGLLGAIAAEQTMISLILLALPTLFVYQAFKNAKEMRVSTRHILEGMADAVDLRDSYTGGHSRRVTEFTHQILNQLGRTGSEVELIVSAARVHDIGKIGIPDNVLNKATALTREERDIMETHPDRGADLLKRHADFARGIEIVRHHHEAWDGSGYPHGLQGKNIPFGARVVAVADSFDAMTSDRPYRQGMTVERALQILEQGSGQQWDPDIVTAFTTAVVRDLSSAVKKKPAPARRPADEGMPAYA